MQGKYWGFIPHEHGSNKSIIIICSVAAYVYICVIIIQMPKMQNSMEGEWQKESKQKKEKEMKIQTTLGSRHQSEAYYYSN